MLFPLLVWIVLEASPLISGAEYQCGRSVDYIVPYTPLCLHHNTTVSTPVRAMLGRVSTRLQLVPGQPVELHPSYRDSTLSLKSSKTVCYVLSKQRCQVADVKEVGREIRSAYTMDKEQVDHTPPSHELLLLHVALPAVALLLLSPLVMAAFLCCPGGSNTKQTFSRTFSKRDKGKGLSASTDISINITDSNHPLGSDHCTTFQKEAQETQHANQHVLSPVALGRPSRTQSEPSLLEQLSPQGMLGSAPHILESSLDIGTRPESYQEGQHLGTSVFSIHSLGPRVPPEGSSLGNLASFEKQTPHWTRTPSPHHPPDMPPPPRIPPPPSNAHIRQNSTPISVPPLTSPLQKPRPLTVVGEPSDHHSILGPRCPIPAIPPKPHLLPSSPPLSPVSLSESEVLGPVRPGRVNPYRVVHQPSPSLTSLPNLPHTSDGSLCIQCGARLSGGTVPDLEPVVPAEETTTEEEPHSAAPSDELCQQCQVSDPHYQELNSPSDEDETSNDGDASLLPDPVYERIGSIRRHHVLNVPTSHSHTSDDRSQPTSRPPAPSPPSSAHMESSLQTSMSSSLSPRHFPLPSEGAPLPPRPPILKILKKGDSSGSSHDYESLPSTFDQSPDTTYARITSPEEGGATTPPFVPENSQRAQMLKIDSQGYAEVVRKEEDEPHTPDPDPGYSPYLPLSPSNGQAVASDYEVPVCITSLPGSSPLHLQPATTQLSPSLFQSSPTHSPSSPIPVPSPIPPSSTPHTLPPSSTQTTVPAPLKRQGAVTDNAVTVTKRSMQVVPMQDRQSLEDRRDSTHSTASYHLSFRFSTTSSTLGESRSDSLLAIAEEDMEHTDQMSSGGEAMEQRQLPTLECADQRTADKIGKKDKIYEVENRSRTNSYPVRAGNQPGVDVASHKHKAQTMRMLISFNKDSQAV